MKNRLPLLAILALMLGLNFTVQAQDKPAEDHSYKPLTLKLNDTGSKYIRFLIWHQQWLETNNLATAENAEAPKLQLNSSARRSRFLAYAQISPRFLILSHWGLNSLNAGNLTSLGNNGDAPQLFLHDAWTEFKVTPALYIGTGLHYWKGLTRLSSASTLNFMTMDQARPFAHWHSLGVTDQFARHLGIYAKGAVGKFDYRVAINNPGRMGITTNIATENNSGFAYTGVGNLDKDGNPTGNTIVEGYGRYQIFEKESILLPFNVGSYLGTKKVLAIGAGFFAHPNGTYNATTGEHGNVSHAAVDVYLDMPVTGGGCFNAYASFINFNYGDNYMARWAGTGTNLYAQAGFLIPGSKVMPYIALQNGNYEGLAEPVKSFDAGVNYFINGHNAKLTLEYHSIKNHPSEGGAVGTQQIRMQAHVFL